MGTTVGSLRARKKAATEAALQESALSLFAQKGYDATTIEEIVADADVSRRTFFRYFGSKEEVIFKGAADDFEAFRRCLLDRPREERDVEALKQATVEFVKYLEARKAPILDFVEVIVASPTLRARSAELQGTWSAEDPKRG
jgi:AcrR family transcriptional regulator